MQHLIDAILLLRAEVEQTKGEADRDFKRSGNLLWNFLPRWGKIFSQSVSSIKWKRCSLLFRECYTVWMGKNQFSTSMKNSKRNSKKKWGGGEVPFIRLDQRNFFFFYTQKFSLSLSFFSSSRFLSLLNFKRYTRNFLETLSIPSIFPSNRTRPPIFLQSCHASFRNWKRVWNNWTEKEHGPIVQTGDPKTDGVLPSIGIDTMHGCMDGCSGMA